MIYSQQIPRLMNEESILESTRIAHGSRTLDRAAHRRLNAKWSEGIEDHPAPSAPAPGAAPVSREQGLARLAAIGLPVRIAPAVRANG